MTDYVVYDVFTDTLFEGNQLAIIPDATGLNDADLQKIANQFNYSETVFVYPPKDPKNTVNLRIITQTKELSFAGHPIIGSAIALSDLGYNDDMILEAMMSSIPTYVTEGAVKSATFTIDQSPKFIGTIDPSTVAKCMSLLSNNINSKNHPPQIISMGIPFILVELIDLYALAKIQLDIENYIELSRLHRPVFSDRLPMYAYVQTNDGIQARAFDPLSNIMEDAASGNAAAALVGFLSMLKGEPLELILAQGIEMGKPSRIHVAAAMEGHEVTSVKVSGSAVKVMHGTFDF